MKRLTIINPFPSLILLPDSHPEHKRVENRSWPTNHRGRIAIHAGKGRRYGGRRVEAIAEDYGIDPAEMVYGAVVGTADLIGCFDITVIRNGILPRYLKWMMTHQHASGPWCWVLANVHRLPVPIPCDGSLGLPEWTPPDGFDERLVPVDQR